MRGRGNVSIASDLGNILECGGKAFGRIREITKALAAEEGAVGDGGGLRGGTTLCDGYQCLCAGTQSSSRGEEESEGGELRGEGYQSGQKARGVIER